MPDSILVLTTTNGFNKQTIRQRAVKPVAKLDTKFKFGLLSNILIKIWILDRHKTYELKRDSKTLTKKKYPPIPGT